MESEAPPAPVLVTPEAGVEVLEQPISFDWQDVTDPSGVTYVFQIASDPGFTVMVLEKKGLTSSEYTMTELEKLPKAEKEAAVYYWRVRAIDSASNEGAWSTPRTFYIPSEFALPD